MKERNYGIDLLRIVSMLMVVITHIFRFGGVYSENLTGVGRILIVVMDVLCLCAVNCFALISGYVGVRPKHKYSNIISLWLLVFFYGIVFLTVFALVAPKKITFEIVFQSLFPVLSNRYWYFTAYFALFFIMPFLNKGIQNLSDIQLRNTCICIVALFSVISTIGNFWNESIFNLEFGYSVLWLMSLYVIGAYLKRCGDCFFKNHKVRNWFFVYVVGAFLTIISKFIIGSVSKIIGLDNSGGELFQYNSPTILLESIGLFMAFVYLRIPTGMTKVIAYASPLAFSVYIIHYNKFVMSELFANSFSFIIDLPVYLIPIAIIAAGIIVYIMCTLIDILRKYLFMLIRVDRFSDWLERCGHTALKRIPNKYKKEDNES